MTKERFILKFLKQKSLHKATDFFLSGSADFPFDKYDLEDFDRIIEFQKLATQIDTIKSRAKPEKKSPTKTDGDVAVQVRKNLDLTKREASDMRIWYYLNCRFVKYLCWRWNIKKQKELPQSVRNRFFGNVRRNTFARLWWGAELTRLLGDEYTRLLFSDQDVSVQLFERPGFSRADHVLKAYLDTIFRDGAKLVSEKENRELAKKIRIAGSTIVLDSLSYEEVLDLISEYLEQVKGV
jgi:hypothetical protein